MSGEDTNIFPRAVNDRRRHPPRHRHSFPLLIVLQIVISVLHLGFLGFFSWPAFIAVGIGILIWRNAGESERTFLARRHRPSRRPGQPQDTVGVSSWSGSSSARSLAVGGVVLLVIGHAHHRGHPATGRRSAPGHGRGRGRLRAVVAQPASAT